MNNIATLLYNYYYAYIQFKIRVIYQNVLAFSKTSLLIQSYIWVSMVFLTWGNHLHDRIISLEGSDIWAIQVFLRCQY